VRVNPPNQFITLPRIASAYTGAINRLSDRFWEKRFNISTRGCIHPRQGDATRYESVPYHAMFRIMDRLRIGRGDVVVDVGSGMGRAVCVAASYPIREAVGVELERDLHETAAANAAAVRNVRAPIRLHCGSAAEFDFRDITVILFFNPFGPVTMEAVLARIRASLEAQPRTIRIGYVNATCAHVLYQHPWIEFEEGWEMRKWSRVKTPVHFYRATP
jgi:predicted RNA methylase